MSIDVTVILPLYNCGPTLVGQLDRLERTLTEHCQLIIVDDGSSDGTGGLARQFAERVGALFIGLPANCGVAHARNVAIQSAKGEYVWFVDWDDEWDEDILRAMLGRADETSADIVVCRALRIGGGLPARQLDGLAERSVMTGDQALLAVLSGALRGYLWNKLFRRAIVPDEMFPILSSQSDIAGLVPVLAGADRVATLPETLYRHVIRRGSITNSPNPRIENLWAVRQVVHQVVEGSHPQPPRKLVLHFDYAMVYLAVVNTALRLGVRDRDLVGHLRETAALMKWSEIGRVATASPSIAFRSAALKILGGHYAVLYRVFTSARARLYHDSKGG